MTGAGDGSSTGGDAEADDPEVVDLTEWVSWFRTTDHGGVVAIREMLTTAGMVLLVGALLFAVSGVWPPMVAVKSGSMTPHMYPGDLVFIMDETRLPPAAAVGTTGVVTHNRGEQVGYRSFQGYGDVIVYQPDGDQRRVPIIHRARFWVDEGENWYRTKADPAHTQYRSCADDPACPAPHAGFITRGDANQYYDQSQGMSRPVKPAWVEGTAEFRVPWLGCIRLGFPPRCLDPAALTGLTGPLLFLGGVVALVVGNAYLRG